MSVPLATLALFDGHCTRVHLVHDQQAVLPLTHWRQNVCRLHIFHILKSGKQTGVYLHRSPQGGTRRAWGCPLGLQAPIVRECGFLF